MTFASVSIDDPEQLADDRRLVAKANLHAPVFIDAHGEFAQLLMQTFSGEQVSPGGKLGDDERSGVPQLLVIDDQQRIWRQVGGAIHGSEASYLKSRRAFIESAH